VNPHKQTILELDTNELSTFNLLVLVHELEVEIVDEVLDTIHAVDMHIATSVHRDNITFILDITSLHEILVALKRRLAPRGGIDAGNGYNRRAPRRRNRGGGK
jgi:hypothetical protein